MPNIRTTHVSLLVDREVDRDARTTTLALLVDRESPRNIEVTELILLANVESYYNFHDIFNQSDEFSAGRQYFTDFTEEIAPVDCEYVPETDFYYPVGYPLQQMQDAWVQNRWRQPILNGERVIRHSAATSARSALLWYQPGVFEDVVVTTQVRFNAANPKRPGPVLRASGDATNETGYMFLPRRADNILEISRYLDGSYTQLATTPFSFTGGVWYNLKAECIGSTLRMKFWLDGIDEPVDWQLTYNDRGTEIPKMSGNTSPSGVASASSIWNAGLDAYYAMDHSNSTYWATGGGDMPCWLAYDFNGNNVKKILEYGIRTRPDANDGSPKDWEFQGYDTETSSWVTLHTVTNETNWANGEERFYAATEVDTVYQQYRVNITANNGRHTTNIAAFRLFSENTPAYIQRGYCGLFDLDTGISYARHFRVVGTPVSPSNWRHGWTRPASQCVPYVTLDGLKIWNPEASAARKFLIWGTPQCDDEIEITTRVSSTLIHDGLHFLRIQGNGLQTESGYNVVMNGTTGLRIFRYRGGEWVTLASILYTIADNEWINFRFYHNRAGKVLRLRVWRDNESEPTDWQIDTTDTDSVLYDAKGFIGVGSFQGNNDTQTYSFIGVGTGGLPAPREAV